MSNLTYSQTDSGLEVVILNTGEAFCTQSSYSRWTGVDRTTIVKRCGTLEILEISDLQADVKEFTKDVQEFTPLIRTQIETDGGLQKVVLVPAKVMARWLAKDNPELFDEMLNYSATTFLYKMAGYELQSPIKKEVVETKPQLTLDQEIRLELDILQQCLVVADLDSKLVSGVMLNHAGSRLPSLKPAIGESHTLLAASNETDLLLTPTKIGKELNLSAVKVNNLLMALGYQVKNLSKKSKTEPDYFPTDLGKPYAGNTIATGKLQKEGADNTSYQHLKWKAEIIDILREQLKEV